MARKIAGVIAILALLVHLSATQNYTYKVKYLEVPVDHFSFANNATFKLRYLVNDAYWYSDGPIFFYTGNEGKIETFAENTGFMWEIAPEFQAMIVFAEHRYYGESLPFGNKSFQDPEHLGYLTSTQALADFVDVINDIQSNNNASQSNKNPVIVFGGSYGGMLSAWLRMKYPGSVLGAVSSSAPVWYFKDLVPCDIFNQITTRSFRHSSSKADCSKGIKLSWAMLRHTASTREGKSWLSNQWKLCKPLKTVDDVDYLIKWLTDVYGMLAMLNYPYSTNFVIPLPANPVEAFCNHFKSIPDKPRDLLETLGKAINVYANYTGTTKCFDISHSTNGSLGEAGWDFQACTEIIMPMCSRENDMFEDNPWNFTSFSDSCFKRFKVRTRSADLPVTEYGGKDIHATSNIIFSNGLLDPWSGGGILNNISKSVLAVVIPEAAHHLDLRASNLADPASVMAARNFIRSVIKQWLRNFYRERMNVYF